MSAYKIRKIYIENFKHIDNVLLDFTDKDLIVLDGPNGFGKTTIFDVIELVLCGKVSRVTNTNDGRYGYKDFLFSNNNNMDSIIKIEFYNEEKRFTLVKRFNSGVNLKAAELRPDNWNVFETYLLENFEDSFLDCQPTDMEVIYSKLGLDDFNRYFSLFYYIQQENNTYFLKKSAKDRMNELAHLFDTYEEQQQADKLSKLKAELEKEKRNIEGKDGLLTNKEKALTTLTTGIQSVQVDKLVKEEYFQLLQGSLPLQEWDKNNVIVNEKTRDLYLRDLRNLYNFVKHFDEFLKARENEVIQRYAQNDKLLNNTIISANFLDDIEKLKELKQKERKISKLKQCLNKENLQKQMNKFPWKDLETLVELDIDIKAIQLKFELLVDYKKSANDLSVILQELNSTRDTLMEHFNKINHLGFEGEESCPLCGKDWKSYELLIKNVQLKREAFQKHYDLSSKKYEDELNLLYTNYLDPILQWIDNYLSNTDNIVDEEFFNQLTSSIKHKQATEVFIEWCRKNGLDIKGFNNKMEYVTDLEERKEKLIALLINKKHKIKSGYSESEEKYSSFVSIFLNLFEEEEERVRSLELEQIVKKANYIKYQYYHNSSEAIRQLEEEIRQLKMRLTNIKLGIEKIKEAIQIYVKQISSHWKRIMRDIEIPFYIYSGKILQDYQRGLGLFIQENEGDGAKNIKFISNNTDHDAINYLSSGQLSGLIIAFTLALNKVYGNNSMQVLLIDDPVQTMDEINMASFVELLRNEFKDKQIFLSTHEDDVSRYIRYKFKKYNIETLRLNVKNKLYM
ncbi:AAA family ATPase [Bacillus wiedmannii]|uniref:AAA family ATPase n=1 Tax=Bacillus wiedmannii TaxID=1890302 RepID=UPI002E1CC71E|nr:AAA family ATPase [Bacillus wiedmannii]